MGKILPLCKSMWEQFEAIVYNGAMGNHLPDSLFGLGVAFISLRSAYGSCNFVKIFLHLTADFHPKQMIVAFQQLISYLAF